MQEHGSLTHRAHVVGTWAGGKNAGWLDLALWRNQDPERGTCGREIPIMTPPHTSDCGGESPCVTIENTDSLSLSLKDSGVPKD